MAEHSEEGKLEPLVIFYDSEASNGNVYYGDVIEIAATCHPGVVVGSFERLINTKQNLGSFAINESGITEELLCDKPFIDKVIVEFLDWIDEMVVLAKKKNNTCYFPVLFAHGGYQFDFLILFANLERKGMPYRKFSDSDIHFADSFLFCQQLQQDGNQCLQNTRLSIDGLFHNFFPKHTIKGRHRAMGDVKAMVKIFTQTPLKNVLHLMSVSTTVERVKYFVSQSSAKEQQLIFEEKMAALDPCSRNMCSKRLIKEGLTYDLLKTVFQNCSSYMDFWQTLKKIGIERKVAKHFTSQFGAMGLENQGSLGYNLNAAMQNGSISNGSSKDSNGHSDRAVNGDSVSSNGDSKILVSKTSMVETSNSNKETSSCKSKDVIGTIHAERATSSSRAFEERPLDYAVTSSADERTKAYALPRSAKQHDSKKDASNNDKVASEVERRSCPETVTGLESTITDILSPENTSNSRDPSNCNGDENWDSEIENSVRRGHFVLRFNEVIPSSIVQEDVCSSSRGSSAGQMTTCRQRTDVKASHSKRAPTQPEAGQWKQNVGNKRESASHTNRSGDVIGSGVGRRHEHANVKKGGESSVGFNKSSKYTQNQDTTLDVVHSNKTMRKEISGTRDKAPVVSSDDKKQETLFSSEGLAQKTPGTQPKSKGPFVSSEDTKQGTLIYSAGTERMKNTSDGNLPKVADEADSKTSSFSAGEIRQKELDQKGAKTKKSGKFSSKKKPSSVTFLTPVEGASADSTDLTGGDVGMTTVYIGDVPILVPVKKYSVPCEDQLDQPNCQDKELETGNGSLSTDGSTISRNEGGTPSNEISRNPTTDAEEMVLSKESEDGSSVSPKVEDGQRQKMHEFEKVAKDLVSTPPCKTSIPDKVPSTSVNESLSSSSYETSDTGSNLDYIHQTPPTFNEESKNETWNASSNHCPSGNNADIRGSGDQATLLVGQDNNEPTAPTTEGHSSCDMDNASNIGLGSENVCEDNENQADNEQDGIPLGPSSEVDTTPDVASQEQMNGYPEEPWPNSDVAYPNPSMYPVPPPQYPFQMPYPTPMPSAYGFYPGLPHMMPMIPGPRPVHYPSMPFASQGMMPFGGFPPRFPMPMPMFPPSLYPTVQEGTPPNFDVSVQEQVPQTSSSPDVLGIPDNRIQTSEYQNNKTPGISNVSFSTSSDDHSARSSPFPVDDSFGKTTPLTTPHRSPVDENSPGALSSSDKGEKGHLGHTRRKGYRKDTRPARYHTDERSRRTNRNGPWRGSSYRDNVNRKSFSDKELHADQVDASGGKTRGKDTASEERKKTKGSDKLSKEDKHSSRHARESSDQDKKSDSNSPKSSPKSDQSTPPRRGKEKDVKPKHGTLKLSPNNSKDFESDHASPRVSPTKSKSEQLTPPRKVDKDYSPKTSRRDTRSERSEHPKEERNTSSEPTDTLQTSPPSSKSNQELSIKSAQNDSHKFVDINNRVSRNPVESQESSRTSNLHASPNKASSRARAHPSDSTSSDGTPQVASVSSTQSLSDLPATASSMTDKKNNKLVSSEKEPKTQDQKDEAKVIPPRSLSKEAKHQQNESRSTENKNVKWPQSALASQKFKETPKPQRDPRTRRVRESHSSGSDRGKRVQPHRQSVGSQRKEDVKAEQPKATDPAPDEKKNKDGITASEKEQSKEPFSASVKDIKAKSDDKTWKNSTGHSDSKKGVNYRDVLLGKQNTKAIGDEKQGPRTNGTLSSDVVKEGSSGAMEPRPHPQAATTAPSKESHLKNHPKSESGPMKNPCGTPHPGDQAKTVKKEYRSEREISQTKQPYKDSRGLTATRGSTVSRDPAPRTNTRNSTRNRHYDTNNNNNFQSTAYKSTKS